MDLMHLFTVSQTGFLHQSSYWGTLDSGQFYFMTADLCLIFSPNSNDENQEIKGALKSAEVGRKLHINTASV